jgi:hypothetical protein
MKISGMAAEDGLERREDGREIGGAGTGADHGDVSLPFRDVQGQLRGSADGAKVYIGVLRELHQRVPL